MRLNLPSPLFPVLFNGYLSQVDDPKDHIECGIWGEVNPGNAEYELIVEVYRPDDSLDMTTRVQTDSEGRFLESLFVRPENEVPFGDWEIMIILEEDSEHYSYSDSQLVKRAGIPGFPWQSIFIALLIIRIYMKPSS